MCKPVNIVIKEMLIITISSSSGSPYLYLPSDLKSTELEEAYISEYFPTQPKYDIQHRSGSSVPYSFRTVHGSFTSCRIVNNEELRDVACGLSSLSEKTRESNHLQT